MLKRYKTVLCEGSAVITEKKSRFIATVRPVKSEDEAREFIDEIRKKYWNATHNCFAYKIGKKDEIKRFSDDGEPSGTAGMPMLNVLDGEDVKDVAVTVTRYFGGTLLGTGGLLRAYSKASSEALSATGIVELILFNIYSVKCDYNLSGRIRYDIMNNGHIIGETIYTDSVDFRVFAEEEASRYFIKSVQEASNGKISPKLLDTGFGYVLNGKVNMV